MSIKIKKLGTQKQNTTTYNIGHNAKITGALNPSVVTQYCLTVTEIIKHNFTKP